MSDSDSSTDSDPSIDYDTIGGIIRKAAFIKNLELVWGSYTRRDSINGSMGSEFLSKTVQDSS